MNSWLNSVYTDGSSFFVSNPKPRRAETISIRLKVRANERLKHVLLRSREYGREHLYEMKKEETRRGFDWYVVEVTVHEQRFCYQFYLVTELEIFYYTQHRITDYMPDESRDFVILVDYDAPDWMKNAVFYQIFPDRFRNGKPELHVADGEYTYRGHPVQRITDWSKPPGVYEESFCLDFYGGDLYGVIEKLDYLEDLGVNAIYLNPIFWAPSIHRYDALDYELVDPYLGGDEALAQLSEEMHRRGMHLMLDISVNHVSSDAKWFNRDGVFYPLNIGAYHNPHAAERAFFFFDENNDYYKWADVETMPTLNYQSERLRDKIYRAPDAILKKWILPPFNVDAWRFDVADVFARNEHADVHQEVWREMRQELTSVRSDIVFLAEEWTDCTPMFDGKTWDSTMNYFGYGRPARMFLGEPDHFSKRHEVLRKIRPTMSAADLKARILQFYSRLPHVVQSQMLNHLNTHDLTRIYNDPSVNRDEYRSMILLMFTLPGMPSIYYGDERLLNGRATDLEGARFPMDWSPLEKADLETKKNYDLYRLLAHLKRTSPVLIDGGFKILYADGRIFSSARFSEEELLLTVFSGEEKDRRIRFNIADLGFSDADLIETLIGNEIEAEIEGEDLWLTLEAHQGYLLRLR